MASRAEELFRTNSYEPLSERSPPQSASARPLVFLLVVASVVALNAGTQYVAWRLHSHPNLGTPWLTPGELTLRALRAVSVCCIGLSASVALFAPLRRASLPLLS